MRARLILAMVVILMIPGREAQARYCLFSRNASRVKYRIEKYQREKFASSVNARVAGFLDALSEVDRAELRDFEWLGVPARLHLLESLRRQIDAINEEFQVTKFRKAEPDWYGPYLDRGLRLYADRSRVFIEGFLRDLSKARAIRPVDGFEAGSYFVRVYLGDPEEERSDLSEAMAGFMSGFEAYEEYARRFAVVSSDCL
jgi:hypothetical protein